MADAFLADTLGRYVMGKESIVHLTQHSPDFSHSFSNNVKRIADSPIACTRIQNLEFARQRFDSSSRPLGRFVLYFDAIWSTAAEIAAKRAGRAPAKRAVDFLSAVTVEEVLQLALLADAGHESLRVTRFHDSEEYDIADISETISEYVHRIGVLFVQGAATGDCCCRAGLGGWLGGQDRVQARRSRDWASAILRFRQGPPHIFLANPCSLARMSSHMVCACPCAGRARRVPVRAFVSAPSLVCVGGFYVYLPMCLLAGCGFTQHALRMLCDQRVVALPSGVKVFGGHVEPDVISRCMARMSNWVSLTLQSLRAEFPAFELAQAFKVFRLKTSTDKVADMVSLSRSHEDSVKRLAQAFGVDPKRLSEQMQDARLYAARVCRQQPSGDAATHAWAAALGKMSDRRLRSHHPIDALAPVLQRYVAFTGCSTGSVESGVDILNRIAGPPRALLDARSQLGELKLHQDLPGVDRAALIREAQGIWRQVYGSARAASQTVRFSSAKKVSGKPDRLILFSLAWERCRCEVSLRSVLCVFRCSRSPPTSRHALRRSAVLSSASSFVQSLGALATLRARSPLPLRPTYIAGDDRGIVAATTRRFHCSYCTRCGEAEAGAGWRRG